MKLMMYNEHDAVYVGIVTDAGVIKTAVTTDAFYAEGGGIQLLSSYADSGDVVPEDSLAIAPVVPNPGKIMCVGLNYRRHAAESGMAEPKLPVLFSKFNNTIASQGEDVPVSPEWNQVDYESELVVVMGKKAKNVSEADALDYVLGYCNANDLSERELQFVSGQWLLGKTEDKFMPIGPYLVTTDDIPDPQNLSIKGWLNGELRQDSNTADMIFTVAQVIAYATKYMTLNAGDIISTGTPEGVILGIPEDERQWLKAGDEYTVEIEGLGRLSNTLVEA